MKTQDDIRIDLSYNSLNSHHEFSEFSSDSAFSISHSNNTEPQDIFTLAKAFLSMPSYGCDIY